MSDTVGATRGREVPSPEPPLVTIANSFLIAFACDAGLSLLHDLLRGAGAEPPGLLELRTLTAFSVLLASPLFFVWMAISPRVPKAVFLPLLLFCFWYSFGAFPLSLVAEGPAELSAMGSAIQVAFAAGAFLVVRGRTRGRWLLGPDDFDGPRFRVLHTLAFAVATLLIGVPFLLAQSLASTAVAIEARTDGFIDFGSGGISMTERVYRRDDREIRLVGMMHIGSGDAYRDLFRSFERESTVLLQEGVTDDEGRLEAGLDYEPLARALGLDVQMDPGEVLRGDGLDAEASWPHIRHADVDLSEFSQVSIDFLDATAAIIGSDDLATALGGFQAFLDASDEETWKAIEEDVLHKRNRVVVAALDDSLDEYERIIVPWGALHLPAIEAEVLSRGFERETERQHLLLRYATILTALARFAEKAQPTDAVEPAAAE